MNPVFRINRQLVLVALGWTAWVASAVAQVAPSPPPVVPVANTDEEEFVDEYATVATELSDPFERVNRTMFKFNNSVMDRVLKPVARGYEAVVPGLARRGLSSFFTNVRFPVRFVGGVLQGKFDRAAAETGKFVVNSTVGLGGFIKVSDRFPKLQVPREDLGQTLGVWGIGNGPFLVLPVLGPSSMREVVGRVGDFYATPLNWHFMDSLSWEEEVAIKATDVVVELPDIVRNTESLRKAAVDPYIAFRNGYVQFREGEVKR